MNLINGGRYAGATRKGCPGRRDGLNYLVLEAFAQTGLVRHAFSGRAAERAIPLCHLNLARMSDEPSAVLIIDSGWSWS